APVALLARQPFQHPAWSRRLSETTEPSTALAGAGSLYLAARRTLHPFHLFHPVPGDDAWDDRRFRGERAAIADRPGGTGRRLPGRLAGRPRRAAPGPGDCSRSLLPGAGEHSAEPAQRLLHPERDALEHHQLDDFSGRAELPAP